jgi:ribosome-binding factor A
MASEKRRHQIEKRIQQRIARILLHEMKDPRIGFVTITGVEISGDLSVAKVRWSVYDPTERTRTESLFRHAHGFLRTEVARDLQLRSAPQLVFEFDEGIARAERIEEILRKVLPRPDAAAAPAPEPEAEAEAEPAAEGDDRPDA